MYIYLMYVRFFCSPHTHTHACVLLRLDLFHLVVVLHANKKNHEAFLLCVSFHPVHWVPKKLGALLLAFCNPVTLFEQIVVDLVGYDAVPLIFWMLCHKLPHPLGHGHQFTCFRGIERLEPGNLL